jgi:multiple sugar transport system permease protein
LLKDMHGKKLAYVLLFPSLLATIVLIGYPFFNAIYMGFTNYNMAFGTSQFVGLRNYKALLTDPIFLVALKNSLIYTAIVVVGQFVIGFAVAMLLNISFPLRGVFRGAVLIPWLVPTVVVALTWRWIYAYQYGILNHILKSLGLIGANIDWLGRPGTALISVIIVDIWKAVPFMAIMLLAGLQAIPAELYEAVRTDGGNAYHCFRHVTLPSMRGIISVSLILRTIWTFNRFDLVYLMTQGGPGYASQILPTYSYTLAFTGFNMGKAAAVSGVLMIILTVLTIIYLKAERSESYETY